MRTSNFFCGIIYTLGKQTNQGGKMKFYLVIDDGKEPSVTVVCNKVTATVEKIRQLANDETQQQLLYGFDGDEIVPLQLQTVACFFTRDGKVFASVGDNQFATKLRIKDVLEIVDDSFIKINQGCVVNVNFVQRFGVSIGGALKIVLSNGFCDYVSRREVPSIKRRFGL